MEEEDSHELHPILREGFPDYYPIIGDLGVRPRLGGNRNTGGDRGSYRNEKTRKPVPTFDQTRESSDGTLSVAKTGAAEAISEERTGLLRQRENHATYWNPIWLHKRTLVGFASLFVALAVTLALLGHFSSVQRGFLLWTDNHYAWTYGPTAILVLVVSLWRQVDYWCKKLVPWQELRNGNATARKSILLDYVSPLQLLSFWHAIRLRHLSVIVSITGFALLKVITIISTGLMMVSLTQRPLSETNLTAITHLNGSTYPSVNHVNTNDPPDVVYTAYAVLNSLLPYAEGTSGVSTYPRLRPEHGNDALNYTISAEVDAFFPHVDCEVASIYINEPAPFQTDQPVYVYINATSPACKIQDAGYEIALCQQTQGGCPSRLVSGTSQFANCSSDYEEYPQSLWQLLTMSDIRYGDDGAENWIVKVDNVSGIFCQLTYSMEKVRVWYDFTQNPAVATVEVPSRRSDNTLAEFSNFNFTSEITSAFIAAQHMFGGGQATTSRQDPLARDTLFAIMSSTIGNKTDPLLNTTIMMKAAQEVYKNIAVQIAQKFTVLPSNISIPGQLQSWDDRLHVRGLALWLMFSGLMVMAILSVGLVFLRPRDVVPQDPEPIATTALILARSDGLRDLLLDTGRSKASELRNIVSGHRFSSQRSPTGTFQVEVTGGPSQKPPSQNGDCCMVWWLPLSMLPISFIAMLCLPLVIIAILEALQRRSDRYQGFVALPRDNGYAVDVYARYLPALILLLVATLYNTFDFTVITLAPFSALKGRSITANRSITSSLAGKLPFHAAYAAVKAHHWSTAFSMSGALLASILTILVSGLYSTQYVTSAETAEVERLDVFNTSWQYSVNDDNSAAILTSIIESTNTTAPKFTYGELAFPAIGFNSSTLFSHNSSQVSISTSVPALRASLRCTPALMTSFNYTPDFEEPEAGAFSLAGIAPLPSICSFGGPGVNLSVISWNDSFAINDTRHARYIGSLEDLHVAGWPNDFGYGSVDTADIDDNPPGCPSLVITFGRVRMNNTSPSDITLMLCQQLLQEIRTNVTFDLPELSISTAHPPIPDESSARDLPSGSHGETAFPFRLQSNLYNHLALFNQTRYEFSSGAREPVDSFFQGVLDGRTPTDPASLLGPDNMTHLMTAVQRFYRRYMAQAISANMRKSPSSSSSRVKTTLPATLHNPNNPRLKQNNGSKLTLQIVLAVMVVCACLSYWQASVRRTLPHEPYSIAGLGSLLAGSEMCELKGTKWMGEGLRFRLGWWGVQGVEVRRYGIDVDGDSGFGRDRGG